MAVKLRFKRFGKRGKPTYRLVAIDESKKRQGKEIEVLGHLDPNIDPPKVKLDQKRITYWQSVGAICSKTVSDFLKKERKKT